MNTALVALRMGVVLDEYRETANTRIEPWLVQQALARLGDRQLTVDEQVEIVCATRTPKKVEWPVWWAALPGSAILAAGQAKRPHRPQKRSADFDL
ncbi:hypothetical protein [Sphingomonas antarctica]|uniref:hypothetical protein n=1 Tax=Sphingomonas antarctica TaxID=2040274 RepID=UPI0039E9810A